MVSKDPESTASKAVRHAVDNDCRKRMARGLLELLEREFDREAVKALEPKARAAFGGIWLRDMAQTLGATLGRTFKGYPFGFLRELRRTFESGLRAGASMESTPAASMMIVEEIPGQPAQAPPPGPEGKARPSYLDKPEPGSPRAGALEILHSAQSLEHAQQLLGLAMREIAQGLLTRVPNLGNSPEELRALHHDIVVVFLVHIANDLGRSHSGQPDRVTSKSYSLFDEAFAAGYQVDTQDEKGV